MKNYVVALLLCGIATFAFGQPSSLNKKKGDVITSFSGEIINNVDSVTVGINFGRHLDIPEIPDFQVNQQIKIGRDGKFTFNIPHIFKEEQIQYFTIWEKNKGQEYFSDLVLERGDKIFVKIDYSLSRPLLYFSGKGSEKFKCRYEIMNEMEKIDAEKYNTIVQKKPKPSDDWALFFDKPQLDKYIDIKETGERQLLEILNKNRSQISDSVARIIFAQILGDNSEFMRVLAELWIRNQIIPKKSIETALFRNSYATANVSNTVLARAPQYVDYLRMYVLLKCILAKNLSDQPDFITLYNYVMGELSGQVRDRVLFHMINRSADSRIKENFSDMDGTKQLFILKDVIPNITTPAIKNLLITKLNQLNGSLAFNFIGEDLNGKKVRLSDFRGKYVFMDAWFTGCSGCAQLAKKMQKEVKPKLHLDSNLVFVSVCVDRNKSVWLKSVDSEKYSSKSDINLLIERDSFLNHYETNGLPFAIIIDPEGKIIEPVTFLDGPQIVEKIKKAMSNK